MPEAMPGSHRQKLGEALVASGLIDGFQLRSALADQRRWGNRLGKTLVKLGFVEEAPLMRQLSRLMGYPLAEIRDREIAAEVLALVPRSLAEKMRCLPLFVDGDGASRYLYLGMEEPADLDALDALQMRTGLQICPVLIGFQELDDGLRRHYGIGPDADPGATTDELEIGGGVVGPDCLLHGDEALSIESDPSAPEAPSVETDPAPATREPVARSAARPGPASSGEVPTRRILQALTQLLIERGVFTGEELVAQIRKLGEGD